MELAAWDGNDDIRVCNCVEMLSCADFPVPWDIIGDVINKPAALCRLKWQELCMAHQQNKLVAIAESYPAQPDWQQGVLLLANQQIRLPDFVIAAEILAQLVPGGSALQDEPSLTVQTLSVEASVADTTITGSFTHPPAPLSAPAAQKGSSSSYASQLYCTGSPNSEVSNTTSSYSAALAGSSSNSAASHATFLGYTATDATTERVHTLECYSSSGSPVSASCNALDDARLSPCSEFAAGEVRSSSASTCSPAAVSPSDQGRGISLHAAGVGLEAVGVGLGPSVADRQLATAFGGDAFINHSSQCGLTAGSLGHGFLLPVGGDVVDAGALGVDWGTFPAHFHQVAPSSKHNLAAPSSRYMQPRAAAPVKSGTNGAKRRSNRTKQPPNKAQQRQAVLSTAPIRKRKASGASTDTGLVQVTQASAAAAVVTAAAAAAQARPAKRHCIRAESEQQQQCLPMEQDFAGQYWANQEQYLQPGCTAAQCMQWAATAAVHSDHVQASNAAVDPEVLLCQSLYRVTPTAAAAGDQVLQPPDWLADITLAGHESDVDCVQQVLSGRQLPVRSTDPATPEWGPLAMELEAAEELFSSALYHNVPVDLPAQTPWQLAGHLEVLAAPPAAAGSAAIFVQGQPSWQQQQQGASGASAAGLAAQAAADGILGCSFYADLAPAMQEVLAGHQAVANAPPAAADAVNFVQGQQPWQQQQQGASDTTAAGLAAQGASDSTAAGLTAHGPAGDIFSCLTTADLAALMREVLPEPHEVLQQAQVSNTKQDSPELP